MFVVSSDCLAGNADECHEKCDKHLPQFVGAILSDDKNLDFSVGEERIFACDQGYVVNPSLKGFYLDLVKKINLNYIIHVVSVINNNNNNFKTKFKICLISLYLSEIKRNSFWCV